MSKKKVSLSTCGLQKDLGDIETLKFVKSIGADGVDFCLYTDNYDCRNPESIYSKSDDEIYEYYTKVKKCADDLGLAICQTHGRINGFTTDEENNIAEEENARKDCLITSILGSPVCVMHACTNFHLGIDVDPKFMRDLNFEMFNKFLVFAKKYNVQIATETFGDAMRWEKCDFFGNMDEFLKSYNRTCAVGDNKKYFSTCVDTGHSFRASRFPGNPGVGDSIRMLGDSLSVLHINDNNKVRDQHKIPLTGSIEWDDVWDALDEVKFDGYYTLELFLHCFGQNFKKETAEFAVKVMRNILDNRYGG
ncbi:MAG: sugar phosphate isomerase/epimerase [Clostridia bacterium]|nr:sugar phosphate isomerase/epimerase [Clostridia bacterium]